jgi:hypothetical protein
MEYVVGFNWIDVYGCLQHGLTINNCGFNGIFNGNQIILLMFIAWFKHRQLLI